MRVVLLQIGLMDLSLSIDNVIAAVGLAPKNPNGDPVMWPIYTGVLIAILALQPIAPHAVNLLKKYPILEPTAFVLIGYVGVLLIAEETYHVVTGAPVHLPRVREVRRHPVHHFRGAALRVRSHGSPAGDAACAHAVPIMRGIAGVVAIVLWPLEYVIERIAMMG